MVRTVSIHHSVQPPAGAGMGALVGTEVGVAVASVGVFVGTRVNIDVRALAGIATRENEAGITSLSWTMLSAVSEYSQPMAKFSPNLPS